MIENKIDLVFTKDFLTMLDYLLTLITLTIILSNYSFNALSYSIRSHQVVILLACSLCSDPKIAIAALVRYFIEYW